MNAVRKPHPRAVNNRAQDLLLLAKGHYRVTDGRLLAEHARRIVGFHNLYDVSLMSFRDAAWVVVNDLLPVLGIAFTGHRMTEFLISLGPQPITGHGNHPQGYYAGLIEAVLAEACRLQVRDGDRWLLPFALPEADPFVAELLAADDPALLQASR